MPKDMKTPRRPKAETPKGFRDYFGAEVTERAAMLSKIADFYEEEVDTAVAGLLTLMEPVMIAILGVVVGGIVIAMYLPIFDLISKLT